MANYVQQHLEKSSIEIAELRRAKLFSDEETKYIIKSRKEFEYKINGVTKNLSDFKEYIKFEKELLKKIGLQRNKYKIADRKSSIEFRIIKRIRSLYEIASQRFSSDFLLNLEYFKFCKVHNFHKSAAMVLQHLLKVFPDKPEVWQISAGWHAYDRNDFQKAFNVIRKGISIHKTADSLYLEAIKFEILSFQATADKLEKEEALEELQKTCSLKINVYIKEILENVQDIGFYDKIFDVLRQHLFLAPQRGSLIDKLRLKNTAGSWHVLAQNAFKNELEFDSTTGITTEISQNDRINKSIAVYEEGLKTLQDKSENDALWKFYLNWLYDLKEKYDSKFFTNLFLTTLEKAEQETILDKQFYIEWIQLIKDEKMLEIVIDKAIKALPDSEELWMLNLKYAMIRKSKSDVDFIFQKANKEPKLKESKLNLWLAYIQYLKDTKHSSDDIKSFYEQAIQHKSEEISQHFKPLYLRWLAESQKDELKAARAAFQDLATRRPYSKELFHEIVQLELNNDKRDFKFIDRVYETACQQFGKTDIDIWLKYCEYSIKWCKDFNKSQRIYANAENSLAKELICDFRERHAELLANL